MSKPVSKTDLMNSFPYVLSGSAALRMLADVIADELLTAYEAAGAVSIYPRIDELDEELLDILAVDFKIDWWDVEATVEEKRAAFKECWTVHRQLGTAGAVNAAIGAVYESAHITEWYTYNGAPYHYKIDLEFGKQLMDDDKFRRVLERAKHYVNLRSVMDAISVSSARNTGFFSGAVVRTGENAYFSIS